MGDESEDGATGDGDANSSPYSPYLPYSPYSALWRVLTDVGAFSKGVMPGHTLRGYQMGPARAIANSVERGLGVQFAIVFSRQAGKDELLAQLLAYLLARYQRRGGGAVVAAPSFRPQAALSRDRLRDRLANPLTGNLARVRDGYAIEVGRAAARFLSAAPEANARGQTADLLLVANEAQDIRPEVWDAVFDPMAASTNATTVFMGTVWSRDTLLARQLRHLAELEAGDGVRRVWRVPWERVAAELPAYGDRVRARMAQFGPEHPFIRTEYCLEELDGEGGLFPPHRLARMQGDHPRRHRGEPGRRYALLVDVAGEEEGGTGPVAFASATRRDSTALTVVEIDEYGGYGGYGKYGEGDGAHEAARGGQGAAEASSLPYPPYPPYYAVVDRMAWTGVRHAALYATIVDLARTVWRASAVVIDATGVGAGLASFLAAELGRQRPRVRVVPFLFTAASKSALGWDFLGLIDAGRFKEYADDGEALTRLYWDQLRATTYETRPGPGKALRWSVPAGRGHDDLVMSAALCAVLDGLDWRSRTAVGSG